ncbi:hypothetical protein T11_9266 [Trichinella zimbabwensis]|uniref:Uncharacterized protein n=1 Tax=Trichinella zimbabwensis TaxID=268475 RepID=A0A0V1GT31_9BILA|nr:hypothetical protein T11_9266 [Trichinella zimbabwensis]
MKYSISYHVNSESEVANFTPLSGHLSTYVNT